MCKSTTTTTTRRRRRARTYILFSRRHGACTHTRVSPLLSRGDVMRAFLVRPTVKPPLSFSLLSRICFSDGANFRRYGSIGRARSRCGPGRSFDVSCRPYGFCLVNKRRRNAGETVAHRSNTRIPHTLLRSTKLSICISIVAILHQLSTFLIEYN